MPPRHILSPQSRAALFDPPTDPTAIVRYYTFSPEDMKLIRRRRRSTNRLGFAVNLAYLRLPGCVLGPDEVPPVGMLAFIATQIECDPAEFAGYARRDETRWEHLGELQAYLKVRSFRRDDNRAVAYVAIEQATGSDRGDVIVHAMIEYLRDRRILLPAAVTLEKIALAARALARKRTHKNLVEGLSLQAIAGLEALLVVTKERERTPLAWLREWPEAPRQKNLAEVVERLEFVRALDIGLDREKRIHRARYTAIARESAIVSAQHLSRLDRPRRLATLTVFVREMEASLIDAALTMFDKMLGAIFRRADHAHNNNVVDRAKTLDSSMRALLGMAKAMLAAKAKNEDQVATVERALGWERLRTLVAETEAVVVEARPDNLAEVVGRYASIRRLSPIIHGAFVFRSWKEDDPLLTALDVVRSLHTSGAPKLPSQPPTIFLRPAWQKLIKAKAGTDRRAYEVAVMMALRERLRSGDVWVDGSRTFRAFDDFLLPLDVFEARRKAGELGLAITDRFEDWRDENIKRLARLIHERQSFDGGERGMEH